MGTQSEPTFVTRLRVLAEVGFAFGCMHVAFRVVKRFTSFGTWESELGLNFSPGLSMLLVSVLAIALRARIGRRAGLFAQYGVTLRPIRESLGAGLLCVFVLASLGGALVLARVPVMHAKESMSVALAVAGASLLATWALLWSLKRTSITRSLFLPSVLLLASCLLAPILVAVWDGRPFKREALIVAWIVIGSAIGEEVFFRGYVQSRLNDVFGRRWRIQGVAFGPGLLIASAFFGCVHWINPFDYFGGEQSLAWPHALTTAATLYYGFLRERTGSVLAPVFVHALTNLGSRLPELLGAA